MTDNKSIWHSKEEKSTLRGKEGEVLLETRAGSFEIYHGSYGKDGIYFAETKRWCYLSDLLALEQQNQNLLKENDDLKNEKKRTQDELARKDEALNNIFIKIDSLTYQETVDRDKCIKVINKLKQIARQTLKKGGE